jgi:tetratricopeptide (TPR) repeat protein
MDRLQALLDFLDEDPDDSFTRFALAREYQKRGAIEEARTYFEGLVERDPEYVGTYYHLGKLLEGSGRREAAISTYKAGIEVARRHRETHALAELQAALMQAENIGFED